jgi:hypothetical protein
MRISPLTLTVVDMLVGLDNVEQISGMYMMKWLHSRRGGGRSTDAGTHCLGDCWMIAQRKLEGAPKHRHCAWLFSIKYCQVDSVHEVSHCWSNNYSLSPDFTLPRNTASQSHAQTTAQQATSENAQVTSPLRIRRTRPFHPRFLSKMSAYRV